MRHHQRIVAFIVYLFYLVVVMKMCSKYFPDEAAATAACLQVFLVLLMDAGIGGGGVEVVNRISATLISRKGQTKVVRSKVGKG